MRDVNNPRSSAQYYQIDLQLNYMQFLPVFLNVFKNEERYNIYFFFYVVGKYTILTNLIFYCLLLLIVFYLILTNTPKLNTTIGNHQLRY